MPAGGASEGPLGYAAMCARSPRWCPAAASPPAVLSTAQELALVVRVNRRVNAQVRQATDLRIYGVADYWRPAGEGPGAVGDCEDIAIEKRLELVRAGLPDAALFYAVGYRRDLGLHLVLVAHTARGDLVLDNRSPYVAAWSDAPYTWVEREAVGGPGRWRLAVSEASAHAGD